MSLLQPPTSHQEYQENQDIKSEMLAAQTMVEKLLLENAELAEKIIKHLNVERDRKGTMAELSSSDYSGPVASTIDPAQNVKHSALIFDSTSQTTERILSIPVTENLALEPDPIAGTAEKLAGVVVVDASSGYQPLLEEKATPVENEIEQIPLEENEASGTNLAVEDSSSGETSLVPISDAPLIGAPFRFISFMASYDGCESIRYNSGKRKILAFRLQIATQVPLWLALALKKYRKCTIRLPD